MTRITVHVWTSTCNQSKIVSDDHVTINSANLEPSFCSYDITGRFLHMEQSHVHCLIKDLVKLNKSKNPRNTRIGQTTHP